MKIGNHICNDEHVCRKIFGNDRAITIALAEAYDSGVVGYEKNGILIADDDNLLILVSNYMQGNAKRIQTSVYEALIELDWVELCDFIKKNVGDRNIPNDIRRGVTPDRGNIQNQSLAGRDISFNNENNKDIRTEEMLLLNNRKDTEICYPHKNKNEIIDFLAKHEFYRENGKFAWNIKVYNFNETGIVTNGEKCNEDYNLVWAKYIEKDDELFFRACDDALFYIMNGEYTTLGGNDQGRYKFSVEGRSGGWLVLDSIDGSEYECKGVKEFVECLNDMDEKELIDLYKLIINVDLDFSNPKEELEKQYNFIRKTLEDKWDDSEELLKTMIDIEMSSKEIIEVFEKRNVDGKDILKMCRDIKLEDYIIMEIESIIEENTRIMSKLK